MAEHQLQPFGGIGRRMGKAVRLGEQGAPLVPAIGRAQPQSAIGKQAGVACKARLDQRKFVRRIRRFSP